MDHLFVVTFAWLLSRTNWSRDTLETIATFALAGLAIYLTRDMAGHADKAVDYLIGSRFEQQVARELEAPSRAGTGDRTQHPS